VKTLTVKKTTGVSFGEGWHEVVMSKASPGKYSGGEGTKYLDVFFDGYPDSLKLRVHEKYNKDTNEEFAVLNLYRYSNSGIKEVLEGSDGSMTIGIEDEPENLIGNKVNVYFYKNKEGYTNVSEIIAPSVFKNDLEEFDEAGVERMKTSCEERIKRYLNNSPATESSTPDPWD
tara:strand:- start:388 stop:906 length:519 start_codon:yes stop_codon:yes gene_type:complete